MKLLKHLLVVVVFILSLMTFLPVSAQEEQPYYIVQEGDSLWEIAARFNVSLGDLQIANNITDPGQVIIGTRLTIPGLTGVNGQLDTIVVPYGETLRSLSQLYGISEENLARLNRLVSPTELYAGAPLIVPQKKRQSANLPERVNIDPGQSVLELAILQGESPWTIALVNDLSGIWSTSGHEASQINSPAQHSKLSRLPALITKVEVNPLQMVQGGTTVLKVYAPAGWVMRGSLAGYNLNFWNEDYGYVALQGIQSLMPPGVYPLSLEGELPDGKHFSFSQNILIQDANFPYDPTLQVDPVTVDPAVTEPEKKLWESLALPVTPEKMWNGQFVSPVPAELKDCWTSLFGNRRSYNNGPYESFHSGLDFCGQVGTELYAAAPGKVVYTNTLIVRGGVIVIDHGWGVYTAYDHLSKILVQQGDMVQSGQVIGLGGATGRTTGPHLHWEVWVGGVQVNPVDWLSSTFP